MGDKNRSVYERERKSRNQGLIRKQIDAECHAEQICHVNSREQFLGSADEKRVIGRVSPVLRVFVFYRPL